MSITATELKKTLKIYAAFRHSTNPYQDRIKIAESLFGILPSTADLATAKNERIRITS